MSQREQTGAARRASYGAMTSATSIPAKSPRSGILLALGGAMVLSLNDLSIKALSSTYALHQVILLRAVIGMALVLAVIYLVNRRSH